MTYEPLRGIATEGDALMRQTRRMIAFKKAVAAACQLYLRDEPGMLTVLAAQDVLQAICGDAGVSLAEARHVYRHSVLRAIGRAPEEQPGRDWEPLPDPTGPPLWAPMPPP